VGARHDRARPAGRPLTSEGLLIDITERKLAEVRAQHYLDVAGTILLVLRPDETVDLLNRHGRELLGYGEGDLIGRNWYDVVVPEENRAERRANFERTLHGEEQFTYHQGVIVTHAGERRTIAWRNTLLRDERGEVLGILSSGEDITERLRAEDEISRLAYFDPLTGLPNRAQLEAELRRCVTRASRTGGPSRCCWSTSTTSSSSTTPSAMGPATGCCGGSPAGCAGCRASEAVTRALPEAEGCSPASAATSS
jgi:PAS domain S-box-containing protein